MVKILAKRVVNNMPKNFITLLSITLIIIVIFVAISLYQTTSKSTIPEATQKQIEPLDPDLNLNLIEDLEKSIR